MPTQTIRVALIRAVDGCCWPEVRLLRAGVLGDGLGALGHRVLRQLAGQQQAHGSLDLPARDGRALVVVSKTRRLRGDTLEDIVHEAVHDGHGLAGDSSVGVHLLQHLVDVDGEALLPAALLLLLIRGAHIFLGLAGLLHGFTRGLRRHRDRYPLSATDNSREQNATRKKTRGAFIWGRGVHESSGRRASHWFARLLPLAPSFGAARRWRVRPTMVVVERSSQ